VGELGWENLTLSNLYTYSHVYTVGAITSQEYRADRSNYSTALFKIFAPPGEIIGTAAKNRSALRRTLSRQIPPGGGHVFRGGDFILRHRPPFLKEENVHNPAAA